MFAISIHLGTTKRLTHSRTIMTIFSFINATNRYEAYNASLTMSTTIKSIPNSQL